MPKRKTNKSALKRFRVTRSGKVLFRKCGKSHLLSTKSAKRRRRLRKWALLSDTRSKSIRRLFGKG